MLLPLFNRPFDKNLNITCCQILPCQTLVFGDSWNKRFILHDEGGACDGQLKCKMYKAYVNTITCIDHAKIAVVRGYQGGYVDIS